MATRLYFGGAVPTFQPAYDTAWESSGSAVKRRLEPIKNGTLASLAAAIATNSPAGAVDVVIAQYVSLPLSGNQTISGAIKGRVRALSSNAAADLRSQCVIRVVKPDGTDRGVLIAADASALASEWATALTNRKMPLGSPATPTSVNAIDGDRIVVEVGYRKHESAVTSRTGTLSLGNPTGTDLAEDETTTTANVPWIEFADTLTFYTGALVTQLPVEAVILPTDQKARISQEPVEAVILPTDQKARLSQMAVEVVISATGGARPTFYATIIG